MKSCQTSERASCPPPRAATPSSANRKPPAYLYVSGFLWARVDHASRAAKNSPLGCFCAVFCDSAAAVRIHPPSLREGYYKTETPVPGSDTGVLGGRGWTTQAAHLKKPRRGFFPRRTIRRVDAVRIHPHENPNLLQTEDRQRISTLTVFLWARVDSNHRS